MDTYTILLNGDPIYGSGTVSTDDDIITGVCEMELNKPGSFEFTIPPGHPYYNSIVIRSSVIELLDKNWDTIFVGSVKEISNDFYNQRKIYCEGALAYLYDTVVEARPAYTGTLADLFKSLIDEHNSKASPWEQIQPGRVTVDEKISGLTLNNYESTLDTIMDELVSKYGGYLQLEGSASTLRLNYLKDDFGESNQVIEFGKNLLDLDNYINGDKLYTVILPLGKTNNGKPLDITSVNNGLNYIEDVEASKKYGRIWKQVDWNDVSDPTVLFKKAEHRLKQNISEAVTIEISAIDLSTIGVDVDQFRVGKKVPVLSMPHRIDQPYICRKIHLDIVDAANSEYVFGDPDKLITELQVEAAATVKKTKRKTDKKAEVTDENNETLIEKALKLFGIDLPDLPADAGIGSVITTFIDNTLKLAIKGPDNKWYATDTQQINK